MRNRLGFKRPLKLMPELRTTFFSNEALVYTSPHAGARSTHLTNEALVYTSPHAGARLTALAVEVLVYTPPTE